MQPPSNKPLYILLIAILILMLLSFIFIVATYFMPAFSQGTFGKIIDPYFEVQNAVVRGEITKASNNMISIKNKKNATRDFKVANNFTFYDYGTTENGGLSSDLTKLPIGKEVTVSLILGANGYEVTSISLVPVATISNPNSGSGQSPFTSPPGLSQPREASRVASPAADRTQ